jgi:hypothetical protein
MFVSRADDVNFATNGIGAYFSDTIIYSNNYLVLPFQPQINNISGVITDTVSWTLVSGEYTATGGENYLTIGNFNNDSNTVDTLTHFNSSFPFAYFYIDDVSLTPCTGIEEQNSSAEIRISPNPFSARIDVTSKRNEPADFALYDVMGRKKLQQSFTNSTSLNAEQLASGIYLYEVRNKSGVIKKGKVVKQ